MKLGFKNVVVVILIFTIVFGMLPTISLGAIYDEESAADAYIGALEACARDVKNTSSLEEQQEIQYNCLKKLLDIWYETGDNASTLSVEEKITTDESGNQQKTYILSDEVERDPNIANIGVVRTIFNVDINMTLGEEKISITANDGSQTQMWAIQYLARNNVTMAKPHVCQK